MTVTNAAGPIGQQSIQDSPVLSVTEVQVHYGAMHAVESISFDVGQGELVALLGANGAGKSSLLRAIVGLERAAAGTVVLLGCELSGIARHRRAQMGMGYVPEGRGVFPTMSVEENILVGLRRTDDRSKALSIAYDLFPVLLGRRKQVAGSMSGGEQQMLSLARAMAGEPKLLLVDELSLGLAPMIVRQLIEKIGQLRDGGMSILLVEQFAHAALQIADRAGIMVRGQMTRLGPAAELAALNHDELAQEYFGTAH